MDKNTTKSHRSGGFTLIELLTVVVLLGILAMIAIVQIGRLGEDAKYAAALAQLRQIRAQLELYRSHYAQLPPFVNNTNDWSSLTTMGHDPNNPSRAFGPYLQSAPENPLRSASIASMIIVGDYDLPPSGQFNAGFVFSESTGNMWLVDKTGAVLK